MFKNFYLWNFGKTPSQIAWITEITDVCYIEDLLYMGFSSAIQHMIMLSSKSFLPTWCVIPNAQGWKIVGNSYNVCRRANHSYHCFEATSVKVRLLTKSFFGSWWWRDKPIVRCKVVCRLCLEIYRVWEIFWPILCRWLWN